MFRRMGVETGVTWNNLLAAADMAAAIKGAIPGGRMRGVRAARLAA
jgi:hydroxymethylglutaryl-CoA lyase